MPNENFDDLVTVLLGNLECLDEKDKTFASSMIIQYEQKGYLSAKQMHWMIILSDRALAAVAQNSAPIDTFAIQFGASTPDAPAQGTVGNFQAVFEFLTSAKKSLKSPKLKLQTESGCPVYVYFAGDTSKFHGCLQIVGEGKYPKAKWYGAINQDGNWSQSKKKFPEQAEVDALLLALGKDPQGTATTHAKITGHCCFCNKPIGNGSDATSATLGYGPQCAKNYGLPWGVNAASEASIKANKYIVGGEATVKEPTKEPGGMDFVTMKLKPDGSVSEALDQVGDAFYKEQGAMVFGPEVDPFIVETLAKPFAQEFGFSVEPTDPDPLLTAPPKKHPKRRADG